jgi:hypothetical protein
MHEKNKAIVLEAFDTLFNKRDYTAAERFWSLNHAIKILQAVAVNGASNKNAGVADEDVERPQHLGCFEHSSLELFSGGAIGFEGKRFASRGFNFLYKLKSFLFRTRISERNGCAV